MRTAGLDYVLAQSKWRGYGGQSRHWDESLEAFTLISALAASTDTIQLYASVGVRAFHPAIIAKMAVTIDDIAPGRFGVNIVAGWNAYEYEQMGMWPEDGYHKYRYAYAEEFMQVMNKLWETGRASHQGKFFTLDDCKSYPTPGHKLPIVCAGQSDAALAFTAKYADIGFVGRIYETPEGLGALNARLQAKAAEHGRKVGAYALLNIIAAPTDAEAKARQDDFLAHADHQSIAEWLKASGRDPSRTSHELDHVRQTFMGFPFVTASYDNVARHLDAIADQGVAGVCLMFPDYVPDLEAFITHVLPQLASRRPRAPTERYRH
ncbi:MAG: LLM class flavin-dependent oxidoreductase [Hyphomicrobiaceae bacterium]